MDGNPDGTDRPRGGQTPPTPGGGPAARRGRPRRRVQPLLTVNRPLLSLPPAIGHRETGDDTITYARERQVPARDAPPPELG